MPRKTMEGRAGKAQPHGASMRPRPDAAENTPAGIAAGRPARGFNEAAARCRGKPSLEHPLVTRMNRFQAGEGFNEAAARCRGKRPDRPRQRLGPPPASMRPRPDAAENGSQVHPGGSPATGFNEAAARCRGKPGVCWCVPRTRTTGFNEAAARCRGKHTAADRRLADEVRASMRPRPDAAENDVRRRMRPSLTMLQ